MNGEDSGKQLSQVTVAMRELESELYAIERESNAVIKGWIKTAEEMTKMSERQRKEAFQKRERFLKELNLREERLEEDYLEAWEHRDLFVHELREMFIDHCNAYKFKDLTVSKEEHEKKKNTLLSLSCSTLGGDNERFSEFLSRFEVTDNIPFEPIPLDRGDFPKHANLHTCIINGREVLAKEYVGLTDAEVQSLAKKYDEMKAKVKHRNLQSIYGRLMKDSNAKNLVILLEKSNNGYPTLQEALFDVEKKQSDLNFHRKISICKNVFESLKWLHEKEVVHGRLKLSNVLLVNESKAKVADYGLGIPVLNGSTDWKYCFHNYTLHFMAPEVIADSTKLSFKSDYWSLGLVVLALFSEKLPFEGKSIDQLKNEISGFNFSKKVNHNSSLPPTLLQVMLDLLEVKPENRTFPKEEVWSTIVQEATFQGTELSHSIWAKARVKSPSRSLSKDIASNDETVLWSQLKPVLSEQLIQERSNLSLSDPLLEKIFLLFLNIPEVQVCGSSLGEIRVSKQIFYRLVEFSNAPTFHDLLKLTKDLSQEPWFYGWAPRTEVEVILNSCNEQKMPRNPFVVRLSTNLTAPPIVISTIISQDNKKVIQHVKVEPKDYLAVGFIPYIKLWTKTKKVKPVDGHKRHLNCFASLLGSNQIDSGSKRQKLSTSAVEINSPFSKML
eukprot:TRINITY_DN3239_c0_g1_i7.p1 TRINITY_DN3239_c0_g1~~TRINITY_DN3239_c0_g1_i7.p1  ORF type:complete len:689 (+),score=142.26 TRINITY_DN3239_c0_g1_i7:63-2069(+)